MRRAPLTPIPFLGGLLTLRLLLAPTRPIPRCAQLGHTDRAKQEFTMGTFHAHRVAVFAAVLGALVTLATTLPMSVARAHITGLDVIPAHPTVGDSVSIRVAGFFPDACWSVQPAVCGWGFNIRVEGIDRWPNPPYCAQVTVDYADTCRYGVLPAGNYQVVFIENGTSSRAPSPESRTLNFTVSDATPARRTSWGQLKIIYR